MESFFALQRVLQWHTYFCKFSVKYSNTDVSKNDTDALLLCKNE